MASQFGGSSFYEYHKAFSARAATLLLSYNKKVDWGKRDQNMFCTIFAGHKANACSICNSLGHATSFCPQAAKDKPSASNNKNVAPTNSTGDTIKPNSDHKGRAKVFHQGKEVCNNFNSQSGCRRDPCYYLHVCCVCHDSGHHAVEGKCQSSNKDRGTPKHSQKQQQ